VSPKKNLILDLLFHWSPLKIPFLQNWLWHIAIVRCSKRLITPLLATFRAYSGSASLNFAVANQFLEVPYCYLKASHFAGLFLSLVAGGRILDAAI